MSNQRSYNHGQFKVQSGRKRIPFSVIRFLLVCDLGLFIFHNAIAPDGEESLWCVPAQLMGTKLGHAYRLKKRNLSADIGLNVVGHQDERVRFLLPFDNQFRQHALG